MHLPFWFSVAALSPAVIPLAVYTRRTTLRLPDASGPQAGKWGDGPAQMTVLVIGESTAAGVGVASHEDGLASQLARQLASRNRHRVCWHTFGVNGIRIAALREQLADQRLPPCNAVFISMGVNDTTGLTSRRRYSQGLSRLIDLVRQQQPQAAIYLLAVPPMHRFTALPSPLRQLLGWRARLLDQQQRDLATATNGVTYLGYPPLNDPSLLAHDGYHPSARGYRVMAEALTAQL